MSPDDTEFKCRICSAYLALEVEDDSGHGNGTSQQVPDDLALRCGCHYHWQCFIDHAADIAISLQCPSCHAALPAQSQVTSSSSTSHSGGHSVAIPVRYVNEGGINDGLDIYPTITEEAYLAAHPEARPARAYHVMCTEGDVDGVVQLLHDLLAENGGDIVQLGHLLRYRDPLAGGLSGLHLAIQEGQEEIVWLLLWVASAVPTELFPDQARCMARSYQIDRLDTAGPDIRTLLDDAGQSARDIAELQGRRWLTILDTGVVRSHD